MRSRFTAHALNDVEHLHRTYLPTAHRPYVAAPDDDAPPLNWTRLVIHSHENGPKPDTAFVDFTAYHRDDSGDHPLHEKSEFLRVAGQWLYSRTVRQGPAPLKSAPKVGRNDLCPCGSGKKFKQCCGK
jgi:SEC-C motif-containing protein